MPRSTPESATTDAAEGGQRSARSTSPGRRLLRRVVRSPGGVIGMGATLLVVAVGLLAPWLAPADPLDPTFTPLVPPSAEHPMGTDGLGRDVLSGVLHGTRTSLIVAGLVCLLALILGSLIGGIAGYRGGLLDDVLMRLTEIFQVLPRFFLAIFVIALFGPGLDRLVLVLGFTSWAILARVVRAEVLSLRHREFAEAARASGASDARILLREIMPNALPAAIVLLGLLLAQVILLEASLGFLGLGDPNVVSWGNLAAQGRRFLQVAWWLSVFPAAAIVVSVLAVNLLSDAFDDALSGRR